MFRASLPVADASDTSLRAGVEDNLAHRLRAAAMEGGRAHDAIHRGFQSDCVGSDLDPDYPVEICLPALLEEAGSTLALDTVSIRRITGDPRVELDRRQVDEKRPIRRSAVGQAVAKRVPSGNGSGHGDDAMLEEDL